MRRSVSTGVFLAACGIAIAALATFSGSVAAQPSAPPTEVKIDNFTFGPAEVTVKVGSTITWTNHDDIPHTVVSTDKEFKSKVLDTDEKFSATLTRAGTFTYFCSIHPKMTGTVVVQ
jgi:plastocyanin